MTTSMTILKENSGVFAELLVKHELKYAYRFFNYFVEHTIVGHQKKIDAFKNEWYEWLTKRELETTNPFLRDEMIKKQLAA